MNVNDLFIKEVSLWLQNKFNSFQVASELFLIGSALNFGKDSINDVDIVQKLSTANEDGLIEFGISIKKLKNEFFDEFNVPLHITTFTQNEICDFEIFMSKNKFIKII